nr:hypothetical protein [Acidobacteriota bacterium]
MNYFNYFTEIEDTFVRRRGKHLLLGTMDWALMTAWKEMGVPLHVVLNGIERAFDSFAAKPRKRSVKTLMYCQEEVEAQYAEWLESQLGAQNGIVDGEQETGADYVEEENLPFPRATILEHMQSARAALLQICEERRRMRDDELCDALTRAAARLGEMEKDFARAAPPSAEKLEEALTTLEKMLDDALSANIPQKELATARSETEAQLEPYRNRMEQPTYEQTFG